MTREEIIEQVKVDYEIVLEEFRVYDTQQALYEAEKDNLSIYANETQGRDIGEEDNVYKANGKWIYASQWYDADWD